MCNSTCTNGRVGLSFITWNVHSLNNKCRKVMEHVRDNNADIVFITETWLASERNNITATFKDYMGIHSITKLENMIQSPGVEELGYCVQVDLILKIRILNYTNFSHLNIVYTH